MIRISKQLVNGDMQIYSWNVTLRLCKDIVVFLQKFHQSTSQFLSQVSPDHNMAIWIIGMYTDWSNFFQRLGVFHLYRIGKGNLFYLVS